MVQETNTSVVTQLHNLTANQILNPLEELKKEVENLKIHFQPKEPIELLTRKQVAKMFSVNLSTIHNWTKKGALTSYGKQGRVYYIRKEIEQSIIQLN